MPFDISAAQVLLVLAIVLLVVGPRRLPGIGRNLGQGLRDFRAGLRGTDVELEASSQPTDRNGPAVPDARR